MEKKAVRSISDKSDKTENCTKVRDLVADPYNVFQETLEWRGGQI